MIYIYVHKTQKGNFEIDGYDDKTGHDLWKREAIASFKDHYSVKYQRQHANNLLSKRNNRLRVKR